MQKEGSNFILALDVQEDPYAKNNQIKVRVSVPIAPELLLEGPKEFLQEKVELVWDSSRQRVRKFKRLVYDKFLLEEQELTLDENEGQIILQQALAERWPKPFESALPLDQMRGRVAFLKQKSPQISFPDFSNFDDLISSSLQR